jgi:hypothetical protein
VSTERARSLAARNVYRRLIQTRGHPSAAPTGYGGEPLRSQRRPQPPQPKTESARCRRDRCPTGNFRNAVLGLTGFASAYVLADVEVHRVNRDSSDAVAERTVRAIESKKGFALEQATRKEARGRDRGGRRPSRADGRARPECPRPLRHLRFPRFSTGVPRTHAQTSTGGPQRPSSRSLCRAGAHLGSCW